MRNRTSHTTLRKTGLHQRAWLAGIAAVALVGVASVTTHDYGTGTQVLGETPTGSGSSRLQPLAATCTGDFCIAGDVTELYPGADKTLVLTVTNKKPVPISVQTI